jgi:hypothetical protein
MNKSKTQRQRQRRHNGKLSRRMKKRGGVPEFLKSILRRKESEKRSPFLEPLHRAHKQILDTKKYNKLRKGVTINPIVGKKVLPNSPADSAVFKKKGKHTVFTLDTPTKGNVKYKLNTEIDEEKQHTAINKVNKQIREKFKPIQDDFVNTLKDEKNKLNKYGHDGTWMCVTSKKQGNWNPTTGDWTFPTEESECEREINDDFVKGTDWSEWISKKNDEHIFCVPSNYELIMNAMSVKGRVVN